MFLSFLLIYELDLLMTVSEPSYITHGNGQFEDHRTKRRTHTQWTDRTMRTTKVVDKTVTAMVILPIPRRRACHPSFPIIASLTSGA